MFDIKNNYWVFTMRKGVNVQGCKITYIKIGG